MEHENEKEPKTPKQLLHKKKKIHYFTKLQMTKIVN